MRCIQLRKFIVGRRELGRSLLSRYEAVSENSVPRPLVDSLRVANQLLGTVCLSRPTKEIVGSV